MIARLGPYPAYKESGIEWLGKVPAEWGVQRLGSLIASVSNRDRAELQLLSVVREKGVIRREADDRNHNVIPDDLANYKVVEPGDLVINKMKAWQGSLGVAGLEGIVSPAYYVYRLRVQHPGYAHALLRSKPYVGALAAASQGIRIGQWDLSTVGLKMVPILIPPQQDQAAIVRYLDHMDSRIERFIEAKERLIELLEEEKQTIIHRAVTRGLERDARLKPSGVPWLGDVPEHWDVVPNRSLLRIKKDLVGEASADFVLLSLTKHGVIARDMVNPEGKFPSSFETYQVIEPGDLIFCLFDIDETPRAVGLASLPGMITGAYTRFTCQDPGAREFIYLYYLAMDHRKLLKPLYTGLRKVITKGEFLAARMPLPPPAERREIVRHVQQLSEAADLASSKARREVTLLREYRSGLISEVVQGRLDVRGAVTRLPKDAEVDTMAASEQSEDVVA